MTTKTKDALKAEIKGELESQKEIKREENRKLNIDFDKVYSMTNTSYKPDKKGRSDYKSASSVERIEAFLKLGRKDPVEYVDGWEVAKQHVTELLAKHA